MNTFLLALLGAGLIVSAVCVFINAGVFLRWLLLGKSGSGFPFVGGFIGLICSQFMDEPVAWWMPLLLDVSYPMAIFCIGRRLWRLKGETGPGLGAPVILPVSVPIGPPSATRVFWVFFGLWYAVSLLTFLIWGEYAGYFWYPINYPVAELLDGLRDYLRSDSRIPVFYVAVVTTLNALLLAALAAVVKRLVSSRKRATKNGDLAQK